MNNNINPVAFFPDCKGYLCDSRLERRGHELWKKLSQHLCSSIRQLAETRAEQKAYYRFLNNEKIEEEELIKEASFRMSQLAKGRHLLCVQDTCEVNLSEHKGRLKSDSGLGRSDKSDTAHCFKLHPGLVLDAYNLSPLGFSHIKVFHRPEKMPDRIERNYKKQPIEEVFDAEQIEVLHLMNKKLQGRTIKLQNRHDPKRTKWAAWVIGRIGGWKGYDSQGPPGVILLKRGLDRLCYIIEGTKLVKKNVGTP